ncbi:MAG: LUD domain-containing protein [Gemmatimonadales bacterium]
MSARETILAAVRRAGVPAVEQPEIPAAWPAARAGRAGRDAGQLSLALPPDAGGADLVRRFVENLRAVGGSAVQLLGPEVLAVAAAAQVAALVEPGGGVVSSVPGLAISTLTLGAEPSRERLDQIELAVIPGRFGVAENGAVWVDEADLVHRALPFVAQHLAIVLPKREIVADMHAAYRRLPRPLPGYGVFISGPSKTADIEQALVVGAQGPRSLVVFLV